MLFMPIILKILCRIANILTYTERNIISIPFSAKHVLNVIEWKVAPSFAEVFDKDFKKTVFETNADRSSFILSPATTQLPQRLWRTLRETPLRVMPFIRMSLRREG